MIDVVKPFTASMTPRNSANGNLGFSFSYLPTGTEVLG